MPLNAPRRAPSRIGRGRGPPGPAEAASWLTRGAGVVYIKAGGEGIGRGLSTATEDSLWKMPRLPILDDDVIKVKRAFPKLSPAVHVCACVLHTHFRHAASPSGCPQL